METPIPIPTLEDIEDPSKYRKIEFDEMKTYYPIIRVQYYFDGTAPRIVIGRTRREGNNHYFDFYEMDMNTMNFAYYHACYTKESVNEKKDPSKSSYYTEFYKKRENDKLEDYADEITKNYDFENNPNYASSIKAEVMVNPDLVGKMAEYLGGKQKKRRRTRRKRRKGRRVRKSRKNRTIFRK